jgi:N-acetyltransferase 10
MIRALPRRSGWDDAWLPAFGVDARRRIGKLLGGAFRGMDVSLAVNLMGDPAGSFGVWSKHDDEEEDGGKPKVDKAALQEIKKRSGAQSTKLTSSELHYHLTPHDLQRLELYSRNLCDHHLIGDLVPSLSQLYFTSRMGPNFRLSSVQAALLCGLGLQHKSIDDITSELNLPTNQVLAMFNKAVKKMSLAFNQILVDEESSKMIGKDALKKAEKRVQSMKDVVEQTLDEDAQEGATVAMEALKSSGVTGTNLVPEIMDPEIMKYALKGTDEEWANALKNKDEVDGSTVQIRRTQEVTPKRKAENSAEILESIMKSDKGASGGKGKKSKSKKKSRKTIG